jgi:hypothetical protein
MEVTLLPIKIDLAEWPEYHDIIIRHVAFAGYEKSAARAQRPYDIFMEHVI